MAESLQRLLQMLPEAMLLVRDGRIVTANLAVAAELGLHPPELEGNLLADHVADREALDRYLRTCLRCRSMNLGAITLRGPEGPVPCRAEGASLPGADPVVVLRLKPRDSASSRFLILNRKISELTGEVRRRMIAERNLRESERKFHQLADSMPQFVWTARPDGFINYFNRQWHEFTGLRVVDGGEECWRLTVHPEDLDACLDAWRQSVATGQIFEFQFRFRDRMQGGYKWFLTRALPAQDESGAVTGWFGTSTDIDEYKRALEAVEEAGRRKDEFLAMLAHELRNPLAPIRNAAQVVAAAGGGSPTLSRASEMIGRQVDHMARLVDDLLDAARITSGKIRLSLSKLSLDGPLRDAAENLRGAAEANGQHLLLEIPQPPPEVEGDAVRLAQVFTNLLGNAVKYSGEGSTIRAAVSTSGPEAVVIVEDNGLGIDKSFVPHVFDLFSQAERSLDRGQGGLGIGLTLVKTLIEMHGGSVSASSAGLGQGSRFEIRLPLSVSETQEPAATGTDSAETEKGGRILVVDDNVDSAESLAMLLSMWGYETRAVHDGEVALGEVRAFRPETVILDIGLPTISGYEVAERLRRTGCKAMLIALSGYGPPPEGEGSRETMFDHHLVKPLDPGRLRSILSSLDPSA